MPPSGDFLIFQCFLVHKGQMSSGFLRDQTLFHQLGACEYECFCLAGHPPQTQMTEPFYSKSLQPVSTFGVVAFVSVW